MLEIHSSVYVRNILAKMHVFTQQGTNLAGMQDSQFDPSEFPLNTHAASAEIDNLTWPSIQD